MKTLTNIHECRLTSGQLDQVNDLLGASASVGASGGTGISFGIDAVSSGYVAENVLINGKESPDGVQFTAGVGLGIDVHIVQSNTVSLLGKIKSNLNQIKNKFDAAVSGFWDKVRK